MSQAEKAISPDALFVGSSFFWMMEPGKGKLTFSMRVSRPTARTQKALDELVSAGLARTEPFNQLGGVTYVPLARFKRPSAALTQSRGHWPITEPIAQGAGGHHA